MYTEKNGPNKRLIKKEKDHTICSTNFKEGTRRKPIGFVIKPRIMPSQQHNYTLFLVEIKPFNSFMTEVPII